MSNRRQRESDFLIQVKTLLGSALHSKDQSYLPYAGADWLDAEMTANLKFIKESGKITNTKTIESIDLILKLQEERRKAYFMSIGSDILTKLSYLVGENKNVRRATDPYIPNIP
jgi:hypothetical protein